MKARLPIPKRVELIFDVLYLGVVLTMAVYLTAVATGGIQRLWGLMAFVLVVGDSVHLAPRMMAAWTGEPERFQTAMGVGKLITSITMTVFYLLLWELGWQLMAEPWTGYTAVVYLLAAVRIALCLFPQNRWGEERPSWSWGLYRNIPFVLQGGMVALLYAGISGRVPGLGLMWLAVVLSFVCYLPVVLLVHRCPKVGMLMLPKTCMYVWMVGMGFFLVGR